MGDSTKRAAWCMPSGMLAVLVATLVPVASPAQSQGQTPAGGIYTCTDAGGRKLTSDRPIPQCLDREQNMLNPSGTVRAKVGPVLTATERAELEEKQKREAELRAQQADERRRERALLIRYPSREVHDRERAEALAQISAVAQMAHKRIEELQLQRRKLDQEMEFYKKDPSKAPAVVRRQLEEIEQGVAAQKRFIAEQDNEQKRIGARFDDELVRLNPLWSEQAARRPPTATVRKSP